MSDMPEIPLDALIMAISAMMMRRKARSETPAQTNTMTPDDYRERDRLNKIREERKRLDEEEMDRAPRAYARRRMRELRKGTRI